MCGCKVSFRFFGCFVGVVFFVVGCAPQLKRPQHVHPRAKAAAEVLSILRSRIQSAVPLKATGRCHLEFYSQAKQRDENFPVKLWVNPPTEFYMQGDVAFNPRAIVVGSNEDEFWLSMKPGELNSYWWGRWSGESGHEKLIISPKLVLEAFGVTVIGDEQSDGGKWFLSSEDGFDVLTQHGRNNRTRKIYVDTYYYLVRRIEDFDRTDNRLISLIELDKYKHIAGDFYVPLVIKLREFSVDDTMSNTIEIGLEHITEVDISDEQRGHMFTRPQPQGFKRIYKIIDGNAVGQKINMGS